MRVAQRGTKATVGVRDLPDQANGTIRTVTRRQSQELPALRITMRSD